MTGIATLPGGNRWKLDKIEFVYGYGRESDADRFFIAKSADLIQLYVELCPAFLGATVVELGIAAGGSTALLSLLAKPRKLIAVELDARPVPALAEFIATRGLSDVVHPHYGINQGDRARLVEIIDAELPGERIDLVVDDASHRYDDTRTSFEVLYPRLRPGGLFIIEDWACNQVQADAVLATPERKRPEVLAGLVAAGIVVPGARPLSSLAVELLLVCGVSGDVVSEITINQHWVAVRRGSAKLDPARFRIADLYTDHWGWMSR